MKNAPFSLGRFGFALNIITIAWISLAVVLFCMPVALPVTASSMNYASVVFAGFASISIAWYFIRGRKSFSGPPVQADANPEDIGVIGGKTIADAESSRTEGGEEKAAYAKEGAGNTYTIGAQ